MKIHVRLFASLRDRLPSETRGRGTLELGAGATLQDLLDRLEIEPRLAQIVLVDGQQAPRDRQERLALVLQNGETISIFPPVAGG
jgi:molybdopterin converting factor small subunit